VTATSFEDLITLATRVAERLKERGDTVSVSESATGGLLAAALVAVPGASAYMVGGSVVYTMDARRALLSAAPPAPKGLRGATEEFAIWQATAIRDVTGTIWGLGETGASGPSGNGYGDPAGHGWCAAVGETTLTRHTLTGTEVRSANMYTFGAAALELLAEALGN
jgi:nicotinamide-nucleotide amidase